MIDNFCLFYLRTTELIEVSESIIFSYLIDNCVCWRINLYILSLRLCDI